MAIHPAYVRLFEEGELANRVARARELLERCVMCGRHCKVNRLDPETRPVCRTGRHAVVSSYGAHHGEEAPLSGWAGSGTIFFGWCNLRCVYCQNWRISHEGEGHEVDGERLAELMLSLQARGCHNVNLVSPSHVVAQILEALLIAAERGLRLPLVYNSGGYDSLESLELLDGAIDVYMPDMKFGDSKVARSYARVSKYLAVNRAAVKEMHRQVGDLVIDERGLARRGLLVRHLVLPAGLANTGKVLKFIAEEISPDTYVNLMDQYHPAYRATDYPPLHRRLEPAEFERALAMAGKYGIRRLDRARTMAPC